MQSVYWNLEEPSPPFLGGSGGMGKGIRKRLEGVKACQVVTKCVTLKVSVLRCLAQGHAVNVHRPSTPAPKSRALSL